MDALEAGYVPVGNEIRPFKALAELVAVLHYHEFVAAHQLFFVVLHLRPDARVVAVSPLVGAAEDHGLLLSITGICIGQRVNQLRTRNAGNIGKTLH